MKKIILLIVISLLTVQLWGQNNTSFNLTVDHLALSVKDVDRSAEFYGNILKFREITNRSKLEGVRWFAVGDGKELHLISIVKENVTLNKAIHVAFATPDFDSFVLMLEEKKIAYSDWPGATNKVNIRADGMKQVFFQDPDGNWIEINSVTQK
ncbi:MAG TPA: VOC family protein [Chryseolinea sp.]|nr:VOC family protein [Chryseolinea sp.]